MIGTPQSCGYIAPEQAEQNRTVQHELQLLCQRSQLLTPPPHTNQQQVESKESNVPRQESREKWVCRRLRRAEETPSHTHTHTHTASCSQWWGHECGTHPCVCVCVCVCKCVLPCRCRRCSATCGRRWTRCRADCWRRPDCQRPRSSPWWTNTHTHTNVSNTTCGQKCADATRLSCSVFLVWGEQNVSVSARPTWHHTTPWIYRRCVQLHRVGGKTSQSWRDIRHINI